MGLALDHCGDSDSATRNVETSELGASMLGDGDCDTVEDLVEQPQLVECRRMLSSRERRTSERGGLLATRNAVEGRREGFLVGSRVGSA